MLAFLALMSLYTVFSFVYFYYLEKVNIIFICGLDTMDTGFKPLDMSA